MLERFAWPKFDADVRQFFARSGPAVIGSAGQQIAILADTILASGMPTGAVSAINYADRLYQLPLGVIGVAAGTVLLPEMTRRLAAGDAPAPQRAQNRSIALSLALRAPFLVGFLLIPEELVRGAYLRGAFDAAADRSASRARGLWLRADSDGADPLRGRRRSSRAATRARRCTVSTPASPSTWR